MDKAKLDFLRNEFIFRLRHLGPEEKGKWGKMNGQQMVEHFTDCVLNASGKLPLKLQNEGERLEKFREFLKSDKPFQETTRNPLLNEEPSPLRHPTLQAAIAELQQELDYMIKRFEDEPGLKTLNPFFGELNFTETIQLLHKHAMHHLAQFGLAEALSLQKLKRTSSSVYL